MPEPTYIDRGATFDPERKYRYRLWRAWAPGPRVAFIMLNPSVADETKLDPTLRRCLGYAQRWGLQGFEVANLFALRSPEPDTLYSAADPEGPDNDAALLDVARRCELVVAGWGSHGSLYHRDKQVIALLQDSCRLTALRLTQAGAPSHPLYLPASLTPFPIPRAP